MASKAAKDWYQCHPTTANGVPSRLYTDENPATTIKGLGYKNAEIAERTIRLTSQPGVRYKQYWTIKAMRERAVHHAHPTTEMKQAIEVFDQWLNNYQSPTPGERQQQETEWKEFRKLCSSQDTYNQHSYGKDPTKEELDRARKDLQAGRNCLLEGLKGTGSYQMHYPITAFVALFGGPGIHGYGHHKKGVNGFSEVLVEGRDGLEELLTSNVPKSKLLLVEQLRSIAISYDAKQQLATIQAKYNESTKTLDQFWKVADSTQSSALINTDQEPSWACKACTFEHAGEAKQVFLACEVCGTSRPSKEKRMNTPLTKPLFHRSPLLSPGSTRKRPSSSNSSAWGSLKPPSEKDVRGRYKRQKGLDAPPPLLEYLIVLDFEWTADNQKKMEPIPEITQFPSVAMQLVQKKKGIAMTPPPITGDIPLPRDLTTPSTEQFSQDAYAISAFDTFVKPTFNPRLTKFSIELTAITQKDVDSAPAIDKALANYLHWLKGLGLIDDNGNRVGNWCFATWGDGDIMSVLRQELQYKRIPLPACFDKWINLKSDSMFKKHYRREPRGGLRSCVESVGAIWEGRAHNGLVDSINTAKIVRHMAQTGFRFVRPTRGLGKDGVPFGQKK